MSETETFFHVTCDIYHLCIFFNISFNVRHLSLAILFNQMFNFKNQTNKCVVVFFITLGLFIKVMVIESFRFFSSVIYNCYNRILFLDYRYRL